MSASLRYLLFTLDGSGNVPPEVSIVQQLVAQGHEVVVAGFSSLKPWFEENGAKVLILQQSEAGVMRDGLNFPSVIMNIIANPSHMTEIPAIVEEVKPDRLIIDGLLFSVLAVLEKGMLKVPGPNSVILHSTVSGLSSVSPMFLPPINGMRQAMQLPAASSMADAWQRSGAHPIVTSIKELEVSSFLPSGSETWRYIGPQIPKPTSQNCAHLPVDDWQSKLPWSLSQSDDPQHRPLVLVSFSTAPSAFTNMASRIMRSVEALKDHNKYRVICTASNAPLPTEVPVSSNTVILPFVPHVQLLPYVSVVISHGGHSTLSAALSFGIPLVFLPDMNDQAVTSQGAEAAGVALKLDGEKATAAEIESAVDTLLKKPEFALNARKLQNSISETKAAAQPLRL